MTRLLPVGVQFVVVSAETTKCHNFRRAKKELGNDGYLRASRNSLLRSKAS